MQNGFLRASRCVSSWCLSFILFLISGVSPAQVLHTLDLTRAENAAEWKPTHDISRLTQPPVGLQIEASGNDPYLQGPSRDFPPGKELWFRIRLRSHQAGTAQLFYFSQQKPINESDSVRFLVPGQDRWSEIRVPLPALGSGTVFRFDPPGTTSNVVTVSSMAFQERTLLPTPDWPAVESGIPGNAFTVQSGPLELRHARERFGLFTVNVAGEPVAVGLSRPLIGYMFHSKPRWCVLAEHAHTTVRYSGAALIVNTSATDEDGATWTIHQHFTPQRIPGAIDVRTEVRVNHDREVIFLPLFFLLPGVGSFGAEKNQALFAGLEFLDKDEPSSSEADIVGPGSHRQVPDTARITIPLMTVQQDERWISLSWERGPPIAAIFDSPDRLFKSGGHLMGLAFPGSDGSNRFEGSLLPYAGQQLAANKPLTLKATLAGGRGLSVIPSVQDYVVRRGLPRVPKLEHDLQSYVHLAASGWLDSQARVGSTFRHAWPGSFTPNPAADVATWMDWLARYTSDPKLAQRLRQAAAADLLPIKSGDLNNAGIGHIRPPVPALVYRQALANIPSARAKAHGLLSRFQPDGSILFHKSPSGLDYGKTHFAPDANGLTAQVVEAELEAAAFCGDADLIHEGLRLLHALDKFDRTVPRGAQTWEVPLHTPDILAAAHLVRAYTIGYELTGDQDLLERAKYWAWTGIPFVYLGNPTGQTVGPYATIAVLGATQWIAPNWMGLPVQWCGLVYADSLYRLVKHDPNGIWKQVADGITASGIQQTWPRGLDPDRQGLLPDSFVLRAQVRNDSAINPGTVQANAPALFGLPPLYDFEVFRESGLLVHAPGRILPNRTRKGLVVPPTTSNVIFTVEGWPSEPYQILFSGLRSKPSVSVNGVDTPVDYAPAERVAAITVRGTAEVSASLE